MSTPPTETGSAPAPEEEEVETDFRITVAGGVLAFIAVIVWSFQTAPFGAGIWYWFGVLFGAIVVAGVAAGIVRRVQRMLG